MRARSVFLAALLAAGVASLDFATDYELRFGVLYLPAVFIATWGAGLGAGVSVAAASAALWLVTAFAKYPYEQDLTHLAEAALHLVMYVVFAWLLAKLKAALALAHERFFSALDSLDAAAWVVDPRDGRLLYANQRLERELPPGEHFDAAHGRWYYVASRAMRWLDGREVQLRIAHDVTEARAAEQLARRQQDQLQRTARLIAVGEMASTLAHELNQPLGAIANYSASSARMLRAGDADPLLLLELMEKCSRQAERAGAVVRRIRDSVRRRPPELRPEDINQMIGEAILAARSETGVDSASVRLELAPGLPQVLADRLLIERAVLNLARNAFEAMQGAPQPAGELTVRSSLNAQGEVEVALADRGEGVPAEAEPALFQPFFTTRTEGTGLGLAICRSIIEYHRGRLWFSRNPEGGSIFSFALPAAP